MTVAVADVLMKTVLIKTELNNAVLNAKASRTADTLRFLIFIWSDVFSIMACNRYGIRTDSAF